MAFERLPEAVDSGQLLGMVAPVGNQGVPIILAKLEWFL